MSVAQAVFCATNEGTTRVQDVPRNWRLGRNLESAPSAAGQRHPHLRHRETLVGLVGVRKAAAVPVKIRHHMPSHRLTNFFPRRNTPECQLRPIPRIMVSAASRLSWPRFPPPLVISSHCLHRSSVLDVRPWGWLTAARAATPCSESILLFKDDLRGGGTQPLYESTLLCVCLTRQSLLLLYRDVVGSEHECGVLR